MSGFGKSKYGGELSWGRLKLKVPQGNETTHLVARLLPPYKNLADEGKWAVYCSVHFGFEGRDRVDPTKTSSRPFVCIEERDMRTKMTTRSCPQCEVIAVRKEALKQKEASLIAARNEDGTPKYTPSDIKALTKDLSDWLQSFNIDRKWYMAAMTEDGKFHILTISHTLKKKLETRIKEQRAMGVDPLDIDTGIWWDFSRQGQKLATEDDVSPVMETHKEGNKVFQSVKQAPMSQAMVDEALAILPNLNEIVTRISREQIVQLTNCSGDPEEVDAIYNGSQPDTRPKTKPMVSSDDIPKAPAAEVPKAAPVAAAPKAVSAPVVETVAVDSEEEEEARQLAEIAAKKAARAKAKLDAVAIAQPPKAPPKAAAPAGFDPSEDLDALNDQDFLSKFPDPSKA
jgi:hypothetical protein